MAEFLVRITLTKPDQVDERWWSDLLQSEGRVGRDYRRNGIIRRIWRIPGTTSNVGIWDAPDASQLHDRITTLPAFGFMQVSVEPLALHYLEAPLEPTR